jgi:NAD(P)-dependent dehydrogenase (short-subunit alcohol dehydrogenase family)
MTGVAGDTLRGEVEPSGIRVMAVEPGAFRTRAYTGFAGQAVTETILEYLPALERVRTTMVEQNGNQPGDPHRGARAVIAAMSQETPPRRLVLGNGGFDAVTSTLTEALHDVPRSEALSRRADFPAS